MKKINLIIIAFKLFVLGCIINCMRYGVERIYNKKTPLSKPHTVRIFRLYENFIEKWSNSEIKYILLCLSFEK